MQRLVLASSSPRRSELLRASGLSFEVARPDIDETPREGENPADYVIRLSRGKALAVGTAIQRADEMAAIVVSADTTVADGNMILGKPADADEAVAMLRHLRGRAHTVYTGLSILDTTHVPGATLASALISALTSSQVLMRDLTDSEIEAYVASGDPEGKAGSYAIQNTEFRPVEALDGCYTNVVGLPLCTLCKLFKQRKIDFPEPTTCSPTELPCTYGAL